MAGKKDEDFQKALATGFAHNRKIGAHTLCDFYHLNQLGVRDIFA